jgi:hypothetical protein
LADSSSTTERWYVFFFFIAGTKPISKKVEGGLVVRERCANCGMLSEIEEHSWKTYLTVFFIPVFPISTGERVLTCNRCGASRRLMRRDVESGSVGESSSPPEPEGRVINCVYCGESVRTPALPGMSVNVSCDHCGRKFEVTLQE